MQFPGSGKPPVGLIIDTDMGGVDDALALSLLYGLDGKNECRVVSVSVSRNNLKAAAMCEVIGRFYAGSVSGAFSSFARTLPVGMWADGTDSGAGPMLEGPLGKLTDKGEPVYTHGIQKMTDTAEAHSLIRNAFTAQHPGNAIAVLLGPATNFVRAMALPGVKESIAEKCRYLVAMGGAFPSGEPEANIRADIPAAQKLFAEWPTPIIVSGSEVGSSLRYPASSIEKDFAWTPNHPVADAYRANKAMPYDAETWDMTAALQAVRPQENYFELSEPGTVTVGPDGRTTFTPSSGGKHRYLILDASKRERVLGTFIELASAKPVPRAPRFRRQQQQEQEQKKADPAKPEIVKPDVKPEAKPEPQP